jgi:hypothetical protein
MHYIPLRKPEVQDRHFHHYGEKPNGATNPWLYRPYSCVAQFGAPLSMALAEMDVVELFRLMRIFVGRYFNGSPLRRPEWSTELRSFARRIA